MLADQMRGAIQAAPRPKLPELAALLWRAYGEGRLSEAEAEALSGEIEARRTLAPAPAAQPARRGARPRTNLSLERRRRWAASGALPPRIAAHFTLAEVAALAVVAAEVAKHGRCTLTLNHIAALAGAGRTSVRNALREARRLGLVAVEERRRATCRNAPNRVTILAPDWRAWITRRGGGKNASPTNTGDSKGPVPQPAEGGKKASEGVERGAAARPGEGHAGFSGRAGAGRRGSPPRPAPAPSCPDRARSAEAPCARTSSCEP